MCDNVYMPVNTLKPGENSYFADVFNRIFLKEKIKLWNKISWKYVPSRQIHENWAWAEIMARRSTDENPLSEPMMTNDDHGHETYRYH